MAYIARTDMSDANVKSWSWNVGTTWHLYSSFVQECTQCAESKTDYDIYHHKMSSLYFGFAALESFLNKEMSEMLRARGRDETAIINELRKTREADKWSKWPILIVDEDILKESVDRLCFMKEIRNEVTHPKRRDHLLYDYIYGYKPEELLEIVSKAMVVIRERQGNSFDYWMIGWNYVGFNFKKGEMSLENNLNSFYYTCGRLGFHPLPTQDEFEKKIMGSYSSFLKLKKAFSELSILIEPKVWGFVSPRLTRRWWDPSIFEND